MVIDDKARASAKRYKKSEVALLEVLIEMDKQDLFIPLGFTGIWEYCRRALALSESQSFYFKNVVQKSQEVPTLREAIQIGTITVSQARRITKVVTQENAKEWIDAAATLPQRELERRVAEANPGAVCERLKPVTATRTALTVGISVEVEKKLRRLMDVLGVSTMEEALETAIGKTLERRDPVRIAYRAFLRKGGPSIRNAIHWRDGQCTVPGCANTRHLNIHHKQHRAHGGSDAPDNLELLCWGHHKMKHL